MSCVSCYVMLCDVLLCNVRNVCNVCNVCYVMLCYVLLCMYVCVSVCMSVCKYVCPGGHSWATIKTQEQIKV